MYDLLFYQQRLHNIIIMKFNLENFKVIASSKTMRRVLWGFGGLIVLLFVFQAGMFVGYHKATFSYRYGDSYHRAFGGGERGFFNGMHKGGYQEPFSGGHGLMGRIVSINLPAIVVADRDGVEKVVLIEKNTEIKKFRDSISSRELAVDNMVVIIGKPGEEGQVEAKLIRLMPSPPPAPMPASTSTSTNKPL